MTDPDPAPSPEPVSESSRLSRILRRCALELGYLLFLLLMLEMTLRLAGVLWMLPRTLTQHRPTERAGEIRILAIGESTTFGLGVEPDSAYPALLEKLFGENNDHPVRVVNVGVPGQTSTSILRSIHRQMEIHQPHLVLALYGINDTNEALNDLASRVVFAFHVPEWAANLRIYRLACIIRDYALHAPKVEGEGAWTFFDRDQRGEDGSWVDNPFYLHQLKLNAAEIIRTVRRSGSVYVQVSYLRSNAPLRETLDAIARDQGVLFIDLHGPEGDREDLFTEDGFHPNEEGHRVMAERILAGLENAGGLDLLVRESERQAP